MKTTDSVGGRDGKWVATTRDYSKIICEDKSFSVVRKMTEGRDDVVYMKVPPAGESHIFAN